MSNVENPSTLKELAVEYAKKQPHQVEQLTEEAPILDIIKWEQASHGLWNAYEDTIGITGPGFVKMNEKLPKMNVESVLKKTDLGIMGGEIFVPEDKAQMFGGEAAYFAKKMPTILRQSGMTTERRLLYENFRQYAIDNKNTVSAASSASGDAFFSIIAVRFVPGEVCGLYSPEGFKNGAMLDVQPLYNGGLHHNEDGVLGHSVRVKGYFGMQLANKKAVGAIVNINKSNQPTAMMIDDLIANVRGTPSNTFLFMHAKARNFLYDIKGGQLRIGNKEKTVNRTVADWSDIPVLCSYNFDDGNEAAVTL